MIIHFLAKYYRKKKFSWDFISYSFLFFCSTAVSSWQDCYHLGLFFLLPWHLSIRKENWAMAHKNVLTNLWRVQFEELNWVFVMSHVSHLSIMTNLNKNIYYYPCIWYWNAEFTLILPSENPSWWRICIWSWGYGNSHRQCIIQ